MKKKIVSVLTALMVLSMSTTVFAASSPTTDRITDTVIDEIRNGVSASVTEVVDLPTTVVTEVSQENVTGAAVSAPSREQVTNAVNRVADVVRAGTIRIEDGERASVAAVINLTAGSYQADAQGNYNISVKVPTLAAGKTVYIVHINNAGTVVETIPVTVGANGQVSFSVRGFSTFAIVEKVSTATAQEELPWAPEYYENLRAQYEAGETAAAAAATAATTASATGTATSPKTAAPAAMSLMAAICLAGAGVCTKKVKFN